MHELSIASNIINIVLDSISNFKEPEVEEVKVLIGSLSNVIPESLNFCYDTLKSDYKELKNSKFEIINSPIKIKCNNCNKIFELKDLLILCPECFKNQIEILQGNELQVLEIKIKD